MDLEGWGDLAIWLHPRPPTFFLFLRTLDLHLSYMTKAGLLL